MSSPAGCGSSGGRGSPATSPASRSLLPRARDRLGSTVSSGSTTAATSSSPTPPRATPGAPSTSRYRTAWHPVAARLCRRGGGARPGLRAGPASWRGVCAEDGYFEQPQGVVEAFAEATHKAGARIGHREVSAVERDEEGRNLQLSDGTAPRGLVVLAAGYGSPALTAPLGLELPIRKEPRYLFFSEPIAERLLEPLVVAPERRFAAKHLADGRVLASDLWADGEPEAGRRHGARPSPAGSSRSCRDSSSSPSTCLSKGSTTSPRTINQSSARCPDWTASGWPPVSAARLHVCPSGRPAARRSIGGEPPHRPSPSCPSAASRPGTLPELQIV